MAKTVTKKSELVKSEPDQGIKLVFPNEASLKEFKFHNGHLEFLGKVREYGKVITVIRRDQE